MGCSQGKFDFGATPSLEIQLHFHQFEYLTLSFEPEEKGLREKAGWQVSFWHFRYSLKQLAGVEHRLVQPGEGFHSLEEGGRTQPWLLGEALSVDSFCVALMKPAFWRRAW